MGDLKVKDNGRALRSFRARPLRVRHSRRESKEVSLEHSASLIHCNTFKKAPLDVRKAISLRLAEFEFGSSDFYYFHEIVIHNL